MVADDDEEIRLGVVQLMSGSSDAAAAVDKGEELVKAARDLKPDVTIVDVSMPVMDGFDAVRRMREARIDCKVVFFSTNGNPLYA